jgi:hypothetical protein
LQFLEEDLANDDQNEDAKTGVEIVSRATAGGPVILPAKDRINDPSIYVLGTLKNLQYNFLHKNGSIPQPLISRFFSTQIDIG